MKIPSRFILSLIALLAFAALPVFGQHGHGAGSSMNGSHSNSSSHDHSGQSGNKTVSDKLSNNTQLAGKLQSLLPQGTNLQTAAQGFKNLGQFVAAVHVSHNLGIPFDQLKSQMIGPPKESLGKAIQALKPDANSKTEVKTANKQAKQDIHDSKSS
jgi:hypothetical protein